MRPLEVFGTFLAKLRGPGRGALLARGASVFLLIHVTGVGVAFGVQVLLARLLGTDGYGTYVYAFNWMALLLLVCRLGLDTASVRLVSAYAAARDWSRLRGFLLATTRVVWSVSVAVGVCLVAFVRFSIDASSPLGATLIVAAFALPFHALMTVRAEQLRGLHRVIESQVPVTLVQPLLFGGIALAISSTGILLVPAVAMGANLVAGAVVFVCCAVMLRRTLAPHIAGLTARFEWRPWRAVVLPLFLISAINVSTQRAGILLVGALVSEREAGIFAAALRIATVSAFGLLAMNAWVAPMISELHEKGQREELQRMIRLAARGIFAITTPIGIAIVVLASPLLGLFGAEFRSAQASLTILALAQVVNALTGPVGLLLTMTGNQGVAARILVGAAVLNVGGCALLIPWVGPLGAAIATGGTIAIQNVAMAIAAWRILGVRATVL